MLIHYSNQDNLKNLIETNNLLVVDFYADWCGPCRRLGPIIEELAEEYKDVTFVKINVDNFAQEAAMFSVSSIPSVFYFKDGKVVNNTNGLLPHDSLKEKIEALRK